MYDYTDAKRKKRILFWTIACVTLNGIMIGNAILSHFFPTTEVVLETLETEDVLFVLIGFFFWLVVFFCCYFFYLLRLWEEIPSEFARTTPGRAAGFSLIPLFHLYWHFVAFLGLYQDMNKATEAYKLGPRFDTTFVKIVCIAWVAVFVFTVVLDATLAIFGELLGIVENALTIVIYWITHKKVFEFIDIKSSVGQ